MASISKETGRESWKLSWREADGRKKAIRLGSMPKKSAEQFRVNFEKLQEIRRAGDSIPQGLGEWLQSIDAELRERLAKAGLVDAEKRLSLSKFCDEFLASRTGVAPATESRDRLVISLLIEHFGGDRRLDSITVRDAEEWRRWLKSDGNRRDVDRTELAENTVRRRTGVARQIFAVAVRWELIRKNPFVGIACAVRENVERRVFVSWDDVLKVIEQAPSVQWRALIAFIRLVGCRVPSELSGLTWADVDFVGKRVLIRSPKTKHHGGDHAMRLVPMFPELVPYLEALAESVGVGVDVPNSAPVFPIAGDSRVNLRTQFSRMIVKAGMVPWEKLFVNLRSSRETELLGAYPATDVCRWMGHSLAIAAKFYAQPRGEIADRAAQETTVQKVVLPVGEMGGTNKETGGEMGAIDDPQEPPSNPESGDIPRKIREIPGPVRALVSIVNKWQAARLGLEPPQNPQGNPEDFEIPVGEMGGMFDNPELLEMLNLWSRLDSKQRSQVLKMARVMAED